MQVETLSRERTALVTAAASRALMLERHERSADLFARMIRARRDLAALLDGRTEPPPLDESAHAEVNFRHRCPCWMTHDILSILYCVAQGFFLLYLQLQIVSSHYWRQMI